MLWLHRREQAVDSQAGGLPQQVQAGLDIPDEGTAAN